MSASAPIRIDAELLNFASAEAIRQRRSAQKQIEYWADLGRLVDSLISTHELVGLRAGLLKLEPVHSNQVDPDELFAAVERDRLALAESLKRGRMVYQKCARRPGYLEAVHPDGRVEIGLFHNGVFEPATA